MDLKILVSAVQSRPCPPVFRVLPRHRLDHRDATLPRTLPSTRGELHRGVAQHRLVDDRVAAIHTLGLVADHLHGHWTRNTGAFELPHRRASEIVKDASGYAGRA